MNEQWVRAGVGKWIGAAATVLLSVTCSMAAGETYYVAPKGNDAWSGTQAEANAARSDGPLATLDRARQLVRARIAKGLTAPITVNIRGGEYALDSTVVFSAEDSGTKSCFVTYQAYRDEQPIFTGAKPLVGWKPCTSEPAGLPEVAKGKLWYCDIPATLKGKWQITTLYDGTTMLPRCSSDELRLANTQMPEDCNRQPKENMRKLKPDQPPVTFSREFHFQGNDLRAWATPGEIEIFIGPTHRWLVNMLPLARVDPATKTAWLAVDPTYHFSPGNAYQVENAIEYLDQPGEWVFHSAEDRLYLWPKRSLAQCDIRAPFLQEFIRVEGIEDKTPVRFVNLKGLHFRHGLRDTWREGDKGLQHDWEMYDKGNAILRFRHAEDCAVRACDLSSSSGGGVRLDLHCQRITVAGNRFTYLGGTGIVLSGYAPGTKDESHDNVVTNNLIHHVGEIYWHSPGIFIAQSGRNLISHNTIHDLAYNGMVISGCRPHEFILHKPLANRREWVSSLRLEECQPFIDKAVGQGKPLDINMYEPLLHARENRIEYNEIYRVMLRLGDGNGIYFSAMGHNNIAQRNYLHDIQGDRGYIRLDDNSGPTAIVENVGVRTSMMFVMKGPGEYRNNFAIDCARMTNKKWAETRLDRVIYFTSAEGASNSRKRGRKGNTESHIFDEFECVSNCLIFAPEAIEHAMLGKDLVSADRRGGAKAGMLYADPLFDTEAIEKKVFRFKPGSPCEKLGIKPLDLSKVGSTLQDPPATAQ